MPASADLDLDRLGAWMAARVAGFVGPLAAAKFAGGQSNPTYRLDAASGAYVLRRKPFGPLLASAHAVEREHRLLAALHPTGFPVPRPYGLCEDGAVLGAPFYVMDLVEGASLADGALPGFTPAQRTRLYETMIDTLAALHAIEPGAVGLGDYGRPGSFFARQVDRWTRQYRAAQTEVAPEMERLIAWLPRTLPAEGRPAIVHGDYRIDNLIMAPDGSAVRAVLDWELSTLGDPLADLAYLLTNWLPGRTGAAAVGDLDLAGLGIPSREAMAARYGARTGREIPALDWYFSFSLFRLAAIVQGIAKRVADGAGSSARAAEVAATFPGLARAAWACAQAAGA